MKKIVIKEFNIVLFYIYGTQSSFANKSFIRIHFIRIYSNRKSLPHLVHSFPGTLQSFPIFCYIRVRTKQVLLCVNHVHVAYTQNKHVATLKF